MFNRHLFNKKRGNQAQEPKPSAKRYINKAHFNKHLMPMIIPELKVISINKARVIEATANRVVDQVEPETLADTGQDQRVGTETTISMAATHATTPPTQTCALSIKQLTLCTSECSSDRQDKIESFIPCGQCNRWCHIQCLSRGVQGFDVCAGCLRSLEQGAKRKRVDSSQASQEESQETVFTPDERHLVDSRCSVSDDIPVDSDDEQTSFKRFKTCELSPSTAEMVSAITKRLVTAVSPNAFLVNDTANLTEPDEVGELLANCDSLDQLTNERLQVNGDCVKKTEEFRRHKNLGKRKNADLKRKNQLLKKKLIASAASRRKHLKKISRLEKQLEDKQRRVSKPDDSTDRQYVAIAKKTGSIILKKVSTAAAGTCDRDVHKYFKKGQSMSTITDAANMHDDDNYLFCMECDDENYGECPVHGPMKRIYDSVVAEGDPLRADHSLPQELTIDQSSLPNAGRGVWTNINVAVGTVFGPYQGKIVAVNSSQARDSVYCWDIVVHKKVQYCIDGSDFASSNWMRYVNCANHDHQQNLTAFQYKRLIFYRAIKAISAGDELLVWYGEAYSKVLGLDSGTPGPETCDVVVSNGGSSSQLSHHQSATKSANKSPENRSHRCRCCDDIFAERATLTRHMLDTHHVRPVYSCKTCYRPFDSVTEMMQHKVVYPTHRSIRRSYVGTAGKQVAATSVLPLPPTPPPPPPSAAAPPKRNGVSKLYLPCDYCSLKFSSLSRLLSHKRRSHQTYRGAHRSRQWKEDVECPACSWFFPSKRFLRQHVIGEHPDVSPDLGTKLKKVTEGAAATSTSENLLNVAGEHPDVSPDLGTKLKEVTEGAAATSTSENLLNVAGEHPDVSPDLSTKLKKVTKGVVATSTSENLLNVAGVVGGGSNNVDVMPSVNDKDKVTGLPPRLSMKMCPLTGAILGVCVDVDLPPKAKLGLCERSQLSLSVTSCNYCYDMIVSSVNWIRYVRRVNDTNKRLANLTFDRHMGHLYYVTTKAVQRGNELVIWKDPKEMTSCVFGGEPNKAPTTAPNAVIPAVSVTPQSIPTTAHVTFDYVLTKVVKCHVCHVICADNSKLATHQLDVHGIQTVYNCRECNEEFASLSTVLLHQANSVHSGLLRYFKQICPFKCTYCWRLFGNERDLGAHKMAEHPDVANDAILQFQCDKCGHYCASKKSFDRHILSHHNEEEPLQSSSRSPVLQEVGLPPGLIARPSTMSQTGQGFGICSTTSIPEGALFGPSRGKLLRLDVPTNIATNCIWQIIKQLQVKQLIEPPDVSAPYNWLRCINFAGNQLQQNLISIEYKGYLFYRAVKPIPKDTELLAWPKSAQLILKKLQGSSVNTSANHIEPSTTKRMQTLENDFLEAQNQATLLPSWSPPPSYQDFVAEKQLVLPMSPSSMANQQVPCNRPPSRVAMSIINPEDCAPRPMISLIRVQQPAQQLGPVSEATTQECEGHDNVGSVAGPDRHMHSILANSRSIDDNRSSSDTVTTESTKSGYGNDTKPGLPLGLILNRSSLSDSGFIVKTSKRVVKGTMFGPFKQNVAFVLGVNIGSYADYKARMIRHLQLLQDTCQLAVGPGVLRHINWTDNPLKNNLISVIHNTLIFYCAVKDIPSGVELMSWPPAKPFTDDQLVKTQAGQALTESATGSRVEFICEQCGKLFETQSRLSRHQLENHNVVMIIFTCTDCQRQFDCDEDVRDHQIESGHQGVGTTLTGPEDEKPLADREALEVQSNVTPATELIKFKKHEPFKCDRCHTTLKSLSQFREHLQSRHQISIELSCSECQRVFNTYQNLEEHQRLLDHSGVDCKLCCLPDAVAADDAEGTTSDGVILDTGFMDTAGLCSVDENDEQVAATPFPSHTENAVGESNAIISSVSSMDTNEVTPTPGSEICTANMYKCIKCNLVFASYFEIILHLASSNHSDFRTELRRLSDIVPTAGTSAAPVTSCGVVAKRPVFACDRCNHSFKSFERLAKHNLIHSQENSKTFKKMKLKCDHCPKMYFSRVALNVHIKADHKTNQNVRTTTPTTSQTTTTDARTTPLAVPADPQLPLSGSVGGSLAVATATTSLMTRDTSAKCHLCAFSCETVLSLRAHQFRAHGITKMYICQACKRQFFNHVGLRIHQLKWKHVGAEINVIRAVNVVGEAAVDTSSSSVANSFPADIVASDAGIIEFNPDIFLNREENVSTDGVVGTGLVETTLNEGDLVPETDGGEIDVLVNEVVEKTISLIGIANSSDPQSSVLEGVENQDKVVGIETGTTSPVEIDDETNVEAGETSVDIDVAKLDGIQARISGADDCDIIPQVINSVLNQTNSTNLIEGDSTENVPVVETAEPSGGDEFHQTDDPIGCTARVTITDDPTDICVGTDGEVDSEETSAGTRGSIESVKVNAPQKDMTANEANVEISDSVGEIGVNSIGDDKRAERAANDVGKMPPVEMVDRGSHKVSGVQVANVDSNTDDDAWLSQVLSDVPPSECAEQDADSRGTEMEIDEIILRGNKTIAQDAGQTVTASDSRATEPSFDFASFGNRNSSVSSDKSVVGTESSDLREDVDGIDSTRDVLDSGIVLSEPPAKAPLENDDNDDKDGDGQAVDDECDSDVEIVVGVGSTANKDIPIIDLESDDTETYDHGPSVSGGNEVAESQFEPKPKVEGNRGNSDDATRTPFQRLATGLGWLSKVLK